MNFKAGIFSDYLSDVEMIQVFSDESLIRKMLQFEMALAKVSADINLIENDAAREINATISKIKIEPGQLTDGTKLNGIPVVPLLSVIKEKLSSSAKSALHFGATSQDVMDTSLNLMYAEGLSIISARLSNLILNLNHLNAKHGSAVLMSRTRSQWALPIAFNEKMITWIAPLNRLSLKIKELEKNIKIVSLGGPVGNRSSFGLHGKELAESLAYELHMHYADNWHSQRDRIAEMTNELSILSGILGKIGSDILVLNQSEVNEVQELADGGGESSAMPHKRNPVLSEALVALARLNAGYQSQILHSLVHVNERDGASWIIEWTLIPFIFNHVATALNHALNISANIQLNTDVMQKHVDEFNKKTQKK